MLLELLELELLELELELELLELELLELELELLVVVSCFWGAWLSLLLLLLNVL